jgi:signal transduction histidine kinase
MSSAERIADLERQLAAANEEMASVLYSISHDLRAPLMVIGGFTDLLLEQAAGLDETRQRYLHRIRDGNIRLTRMLDGLLKLSRIGREPLNVQPIDLVALAHSSLAKLRGLDSNRVVAFDAPVSLAAVGDPSLLGVLVDTLIENAWKFTSTTGDARVTLTSAEGTFCVRDNGTGFDSKHKEKLFKPLQRLHTEKQFPGIGIGLAIAARIVHRHHGQIWAESAPEQGAAVYFTLNSPQGNSTLDKN